VDKSRGVTGEIDPRGTLFIKREEIENKKVREGARKGEPSKGSIGTINTRLLDSD